MYILSENGSQRRVIIVHDGESPKSVNKKFLITLFLSIPMCIYFSAMVAKDFFLGGNRTNSYPQSISNLIDHVSASNNPEMLRKLSEAIVLHFKEMGTLPKDVNMDSLIDEVMHKNYSHLLPNATSTHIDSDTIFSLTGKESSLCLLIFTFCVILSTCAALHGLYMHKIKTEQQNHEVTPSETGAGRTTKCKKGMSILFGVIGLVSVSLGVSALIYAKVHNISLNPAEIFNIGGKFDRILPETLAAYKNLSGSVDVDGFKKVFDNYLNLTNKDYNQLALSSMLLGCVVGLCVLGGVFILASICSLAHSYAFNVKRNEANCHDLVKPSVPPPYTPKPSATDSVPPDYEAINKTQSPPPAYYDHCATGTGTHHRHDAYDDNTPPPYSTLENHQITSTNVRRTLRD